MVPGFLRSAFDFATDMRTAALMMIGGMIVGFSGGTGGSDLELAIGISGGASVIVGAVSIITRAFIADNKEKSPNIPAENVPIPQWMRH